MYTEEDIANQQERLATYRRTLAHYLAQMAVIGSVNIPPSIAHGISEARDNIRKIKETLYGWEVVVDDHPDDEPHNRLPKIESLTKETPAMDTQGKKILLIEDNQAHAQNIKDRLGWLGYVINISYTGESGFTSAKAEQPNLIILDIMLETNDKGFDVLRQLEADPITHDIPVIVYSITGEEIENRLRGFALGALWYLDKSHGITELEAIVRRALKLQPQHKYQAPQRLMPLDFDEKFGKVWIDGRETNIELPALQAKLLTFLVRNRGQICSRDEISHNVYDTIVGNEVIDRLLSRLREKLGDDPQNPRFIESIRGIGYRLVVEKSIS
jgi:DNA-binding response OmpR family regulator